MFGDGLRSFGGGFVGEAPIEEAVTFEFDAGRGRGVAALAMDGVAARVLLGSETFEEEVGAAGGEDLGGIGEPFGVVASVGAFGEVVQDEGGAAEVVAPLTDFCHDVPGGLVVSEVGSFDGRLEAVDDDELCAELHGLDIDVVGSVFVGFVFGLV